LAKSANPVILAGFPAGVAISRVFLTKVTGVAVIAPVSVTCFMFVGAAEANTSAGAPWLICCANAELPPKLNLTRTPGLAASKSLPILVNDSVNDAAANTVTSPDEPAESALPQPASHKAAARPATPSERTTHASGISTTT
jgi:hypothetical protein